MSNILSIRNEARYGCPQADQILFNRHYITGYSYYFRQARWTLEIIDSNRTHVRRVDDFRVDVRVPEMYHQVLSDYKQDPHVYDRGHLVASGDQAGTIISNSETFLLSNMSPQRAGFNQGIWRDLEMAVRELSDKSEVLETYVMSGPIFYFNKAIQMLGECTDKKLGIPIPHAYFKSVLIENNRGTLSMWSFILDNQKSHKHFKEYLIRADKVELLTGITLWNLLIGTDARSKIEKTTLWKT